MCWLLFYCSVQDIEFIEKIEENKRIASFLPPTPRSNTTSTSIESTLEQISLKQKNEQKKKSIKTNGKKRNKSKEPKKDSAELTIKYANTYVLCLLFGFNLCRMFGFFFFFIFVFRHTFEYENEIVYFSFCYPYAYDELQNDLKILDTKFR
jgi:hypothetical protein